MNRQFEHIQARLKTERQHLAEELKLKIGQSVDEVHEGDPFDRAEEAATESLELERRVALVQRMQEQLAEVEYALKKAENGTYGLCDACGQPIPLGRLEAIPQANLCLDCKSLREKKRLFRASVL